MARKATSAATAKSREAKGMKPATFSFTPEELELLDAAQAKGAFATKKATVLAGLAAITKGAPEPTPEQAVRVLARVVKGAPPK